MLLKYVYRLFPHPGKDNCSLKNIIFDKVLKLSVVIITFNEEKNIERCLESVKSVADEIVVLDSFSTYLTR